MIFQEKCVSCYILLTEQISLFEILGNMCITVTCFLGCDIINFETNVVFLIKPYLHMTKTSRQKFSYLENEKSF